MLRVQLEGTRGGVSMQGWRGRGVLVWAVKLPIVRILNGVIFRALSRLMYAVLLGRWSVGVFFAQACYAKQ